MSWLVMDIGCIECGEPSAVVGIFDDEKDARVATREYIDPNHRWGRDGWIGQHSVEIFELDPDADLYVPADDDLVARVDGRDVLDVDVVEGVGA